MKIALTLLMTFILSISAFSATDFTGELSESQTHCMANECENEQSDATCLDACRTLLYQISSYLTAIRNTQGPLLIVIYKENLQLTDRTFNVFRPPI